MAPPVLVGNAVLDPTVLVDSLVLDVIDGLRDELHPAFGVRAYRAYRVIRTWTGKLSGEGRFADVAAELRPQPKIEMWDGIRWAQMTCGLNDAGEIRLAEISLTYTEAQITAQPLGKNQDLFYAITEAHGQGTATRLFGISRPPYIDRERTMGWMIYLRAVQGAPWVP